VTLQPEGHEGNGAECRVPLAAEVVVWAHRWVHSGRSKGLEEKGRLAQRGHTCGREHAYEV